MNKYKITQKDSWRLLDMAKTSIHGVKGEWNDNIAVAWAYAIEVYLLNKGIDPGFTVELNPPEIINDVDDVMIFEEEKKQ